MSFVTSGEHCYDESDRIALAERAVDDLDTRLQMLGGEYRTGKIDRVQAELRLFGLAWQYQHAHADLARALQCEDIAIDTEDLDELIDRLWSTHFSAPANQLEYASLEMHDSFLQEMELELQKTARVEEEKGEDKAVLL